MTENANPTLGKIEDLFKDLVWDNLVKAGVAALFAAVPGLNFWPLRPLVNFVIEHYSEKLFAALKLVVDLQAIAFVNEQARKEFDAASVKLRIIAKNHGIDSEEFRRERENAKAALASLVRFNGT